MDYTNVIKSWRQAATDLKLNIHAPFLLSTADGRQIECLMMLENFGSKKGTVIISTDNMDDFNEPEKVGYYCSALNPLSYSNYDRDIFVDTLIDWGFYGLAPQVPSWYTGHIYE